MNWLPYKGRPLRLTPKEIARGDEGWTIVVRPQSSGKIMVAAINVETGMPFGRKVPFVDDRSEIQEAAQQELRMLSKMGMGGNMADASRMRLAGTGQGIFRQAVDPRKIANIKSKLKKSGDDQSYVLMNNIMWHFMDKFDMDSGEESAWYRLLNMVRDGGRWDEALLRNNVFKIANSLKMKLPSAMFASDLSAQWGPTIHEAYTSYAKDSFDVEGKNWGILISQNARGYTLNFFTPTDSIGKRGKRLKVYEVQLWTANRPSTAWGATLADWLKPSMGPQAAMKVIEKVVTEAKAEGYEITRGENTVKGVERGLPFPAFAKVEDIQGPDITVVMNKNPIEMYSKSEGESLDESRMTYWVKINQRNRRKLQRLAPQLEVARNLDQALKILTQNKIKYDHHSYMQAGWD